ncbi:Tail-specific protease precursor [Lacunisphaera limnophila]|uniref:Tail-specific protease n=1 Tax=Lacunisphaera limnophila TaxID=1838286 RepID=A0A1I7PHB6_9BACT|nr:carboxy terminal-processing peptidase [Lacunisphaera limnophila]AOS42991.1 Tail-specific protease precursor [Lacunisphaera limnophila]
MNLLPRFPLRAALFSLFLAGVLAAAPDRELKTTPLMRQETRTLIQMLEHLHYNKDGMTAADYPQIITAYMQELDPQRLFFTQADEQAFRRQFGPRLETDLAYLGNIDAGFDIYKVYEQRVKTRLTWVFEQLPLGFDFTAQESYAPDRSKSPFPADNVEAEDLWRKRIKYEMLHDLVAKKTTEEAQTTLRKRYERMLKNLGDIETSDIQEMFLTSLTRMYDPHSDYLSADTYQDFSIQMKLSLIGIGAVLGIEEDGYCIVREVVPGGPAYNSGQIHMNDKIVAVQQEGGEPVEVIGMKLRRIVDMIRGTKGTKVTLTILPRTAPDASQTKQVLVTRDVIKLNSARATASIFDLPGEAAGTTLPIGVITLNSFYDGSPEDAAPEDVRNTASQDVAELIAKLQTAGIQALVIDLRRNGGGLLTEAVNLTGLFIKDGPVVQERDFQGRVEIGRDTDSTVAYDGPLAVLTSRFSASASEIFAGALQNYGRAVIIGDSSTHGKGTVQALLEMKNFMPPLSKEITHSGAAKLTVRKFYLPNGASTQKKGVVPDITLPSIDDFLPIGEGTLPHALVWDEIRPTAFTGKALDETFVQPLLQASRTRQESLDEFAYLKKSIDWFREKQDQKTVSLNLDQRLATKEADDEFKKLMDAEVERLAQTNFASREIKLESVLKAEAAGLVPEPTAEEGNTDAPDEDVQSKFDVHLRETLRVVADTLRLKHSDRLSIENPAPLVLHKG